MRIRIEKMITGGLGLARREDGMVVLSRFVLPGETVEVAESVQHRGYAEAELMRVLTRSPDRVEPSCPFYTTCGGCDFQHIEEKTQLRLKGEMIREALLRAGLTAPPAALHPPLGLSPSLWLSPPDPPEADAGGRTGPVPVPKQPDRPHQQLPGGHRSLEPRPPSAPGFLTPP
jgi:tRNA/tmRNA/rRNA uracil-C5-methylase (TrmA/RlmC/RlmD family)